MVKQQPKVLMDLVRDAQNIIKLDADSLNGELFARSLQMVALLKQLLEKLHTLLLDMDLFANKMVLFQLLNQRSFKMENIIFK